MKRMLLLLYFSILSPLHAEYSWERSSAEPLVQGGVDALYNYHFDNAIILLDSAALIDNSHPVVPFVLIAAKWLQSQTQDGYDSSYKMINAEVSNTIPVYKKLIENNPDDPEMVLYLGSTYGIRARTAMAGKDWLDVLYFGYQGLKHIRKAQSMDDKLMDVYMPIGLMEYFACLSPAPIQWAAELVGLSTNCTIGIQNLELAAEKSHYSWIEASNVLTYAYLHIERDYKKAEKIVYPLVEQFPGHPYFSFLKGELLAKTENWDELKKILPDLEEFAKTGPFLQQNECQLKLTYIQALKAFHQKDYATTIDKCNWMLNNYHMEFDWLKGFAHLLRGKSYDILDNRDFAITDYKAVLKMDPYYPEVEEARKSMKKIKEKNKK